MKVLEGLSPYEAACFGIKEAKDEDPFFILDANDLHRKVNVWKENLPRVKPFYAVKCNNDPEVLKMLVHLGIGFDVASVVELKTMLNLGADPSKIVFAHTCKLPSHVLIAKSLKVLKMTFDNIDELYKIKELYPEAHLLLRVLCDGKSDHKLGKKFGTDPLYSTGLLAVAKELELNVVGVSFHVGSRVQDGASYFDAIGVSHWVIEQARSMGFKPHILDIGGGFPQITGVLFTEVAKVINEGLEKFFPNDGPFGPMEIIAEPGRYIVGTALSLVTMVSSRRLVRSFDGKVLEAMYYLNDGIYGSFSFLRYEKRDFKNYIVIRKTSKDYNVSDKQVPTILWGPTCDSNDLVAKDMGMPELHIGDFVFWPAIGDYTLAAQTTFNGLEKAFVRYVISDTS